MTLGLSCIDDERYKTPEAILSPPRSDTYLNRELSQLAFNCRVLAQAEDNRTPLLERLRYLCIVSSNSERALTAKGTKQARKMAAWLDRNLPGNCRVIVSPTVRTTQTADALGRKYKTSAALAPDATAEGVLAAVNWPDNREPVLIVGHQPTLGRLAALLLAGVQQDWAIRKAGVLWIAQRAIDESCVNYLKATIGPELV
jgi:phosphohistidine phosphatase